METILTVVITVLVLVVLGLLVWLISSSFAGRKEIAGQAASLGALTQQLETLKAAQDDTKDKLQKSLLVSAFTTFSKPGSGNLASMGTEKSASCRVQIHK